MKDLTRITISYTDTVKLSLMKDIKKEIECLTEIKQFLEEEKTQI